MRYLGGALLLFVSPISCFVDITNLLPFSPALETSELVFDSESPHQQLAKRDGNCPSNYDSCAYLNIPGYCCPKGQNCAVDAVGHAACCPSGATCIGTVGGSGFVTGGVGAGTSTAAFATAAITAGAGVGAATTTAFGASATGTAFAILSNPYYPFKVIPTTYLNAASCSNAWTGCQTDMASCTASLEGQAVGSVTISAPNFSTAQHATTTYAAISASSICSSLSLAACSGLQVTACSYFGTGNSANARPSVLCGAGVGAAVGIAGQWLLG